MVRRSTNHQINKTSDSIDRVLHRTIEKSQEYPLLPGSQQTQRVFIYFNLFYFKILFYFFRFYVY